MRRSALIAIGIVALLALAGVSLLVAEGLILDGKPHYDAEWAKCTAGDSCVAVPIPCGWTAVNIRHREDAEAYFGYLATVIDLRCSIEEVPVEPPPAACRSGLCVLE